MCSRLRDVGIWLDRSIECCRDLCSRCLSTSERTSLAAVGKDTDPDFIQISGEVLVIVFVVRNVMACILSLYIADWIKVEGVKDAFGEMVAIQYAILSLSVVLYFFGKRIRAFTGRFGPMKKILHGD